MCSKIKTSKNQSLFTLNTPPNAPNKTVQIRRGNKLKDTTPPKKTQQIKIETRKTKKPERPPTSKPLRLKCITVTKPATKEQTEIKISEIAFKIKRLILPAKENRNDTIKIAINETK